MLGFPTACWGRCLLGKIDPSMKAWQQVVSPCFLCWHSLLGGFRFLLGAFCSGSFWQPLTSCLRILGDAGGRRAGGGETSPVQIEKPTENIADSGHKGGPKGPIFLCLGVWSHTQLCSGPILGTVLRDHLWRFSGDSEGAGDSAQVALCARQHPRSLQPKGVVIS